MSKKSNEGFVFLILGLIGLYLLYWIVVSFVLPLISYLWFHGSGYLFLACLVLGGYRAVVNYSIAFKKNVQFEKP